MNVESFWPLDVALAKGFTLEWEGKRWTFSPLSLDDWAEIVSLARSDALDVYLRSTANNTVSSRQRAMDINAIIFGAVGQQMMDQVRSPKLRRMAVKRSLLKAHPEIADAEVEKLVHDEQQAILLETLVEVLSTAPRIQDAPKDEDNDPPNPTQQPSSTTC